MSARRGVPRRQCRAPFHSLRRHPPRRAHRRAHASRARHTVLRAECRRSRRSAAPAPTGHRARTDTVADRRGEATAPGTRHRREAAASRRINARQRRVARPRLEGETDRSGPPSRQMLASQSQKLPTVRGSLGRRPPARAPGPTRRRARQGRWTLPSRRSTALRIPRSWRHQPASSSSSPVRAAALIANAPNEPGASMGGDELLA